MNELVALALPGGRGFVDALQQVWDDGDAALPLDLRLPASAWNAVLDVMAPSRLITPTGVLRVEGGRPVEVGDALVVTTSGTTGVPKGVVLTHDAVAASAAATSAVLDVDPSSDRWLACLPLSHIGGLSVITRALHTRTPVDVHDGFDAAAVDDSPATLVSLVSTALRRIDPTRFRMIVLGGAAPPPDRPDNAVATYGMTETGSGVVYDGVPLEGVEVEVRGGEIHVRAPMLLRAYRDGTVPLDAQGWFATGDLGAFDDGVLSVDGRAGDLIITGGENVWPSAVENALRAHPDVADVAVVGRPDPEWGHVVTAIVVPTGPAPSLDQLRSLVKQTLPAFCAPRTLELVESLARTPSGKIARNRL